MEGFRGGWMCFSKASWREDVAHRQRPAARTLGPSEAVSLGIDCLVRQRDMVVGC